MQVYACCFFSVASLLRSKLWQAGYGEETAFVPQACITARKTLKTGCAVSIKLTYLQTQGLNLQDCLSMTKTPLA